MTTRVLEIELIRPIPERQSLGCAQAMALLRLNGRPAGCLWLECPGGTLSAAALREAILAQPWLCRQLAEDALTAWLLQDGSPAVGTHPTWSVIVCTRNRPADLRRCLDALCRLQTPGGEIVVVDNASTGDATLRVALEYGALYAWEGRVGLNWARSRGAQVAQGEIVIYTDDDAVADPGWVSAILEPFSHPRVAAVTGLALPLELETEAQELFERYGGFSRGFRRRAFDHTQIAPAAAGLVGAGVNMAIRRDLVTGMRLFDVELDCGTPARSGGDAYAFYRLLCEGYQIVYTPEALVWHRHRREYAALRRTLAGYSVGGFAFLARCFFRHGDWQALGVAASWFYDDHLHQLARCLLRRPRALPLDLVLPQLLACPAGLWAYWTTARRERSARTAARIGAQVAGEVAGGRA